MSKNAILILSGYNNRGIIAFCRFFKENQIPFFIVSSGKGDLINYTSYKENIIFERKNNQLEVTDFIKYKELILSKIQVENIVILPSTEYLNRFLLLNKMNLEKENFIIPLVEEQLYSEISDKYSFGNLCSENGIDIPKEYEEVSMSNIPFVAKPKHYFVNGKTVNQKPVIINKSDDFEKFTALKSEADFYYQEFVGGKSFYLLYYFDNEGKYSVYSQQNLIQQDNGLSIIGAVSSDFHQKEISDKFAVLFLEKKYRGFLMIEVKEYNGKIYMIEANPRIWGPSQLVNDSKMDLFYKFAVDYDLLKSDKKADVNYKTNVKYFWSGGIFEDNRNKNTIAFHHYNKENLEREYDEWNESDVYKREDTLQLYLKELNGL